MNKISALIIISILVLTIAYADFTEDIAGAWAERESFHAKLIRTDISPMDTVVQEGIFAIRKPDAIYRTPSELILYYDGVLYTYSSGSDVGTKTEMEQFLYADIGTLLEHLEEDFELTYSKDQEELVLSGKAGDGNITEFTVFIDDEYVPHEIRWIDIFGYNTVLQFENISFGEPGDIFSPPEDIEFIEQ